MMSNTLQNIRILIIDDNPNLLSVFEKMLRIKGFSVTAETTIEAGFRHLENELYHIVFVDAPLDDHDRKQIFTLLQENQIFQKTSLILSSAIDLGTLELDKWQKHGLYSYLKKPVKRSTIMEILDTLSIKINFNIPQITLAPIAEEKLLVRN